MHHAGVSDAGDLHGRRGRSCNFDTHRPGKIGMRMPRSLVNLPAYDDDALNVIVECPRGAKMKLAYEPKSGVFEVGRALPLGITYPFDFGFVPTPLRTESNSGAVTVAAEGQSAPHPPQLFYTSAKTGQYA